jgi:TrmH family RNA methyltransferase
MGVFKKYNMNIDHNANQVLLVNPSDMGNLGTIIRVMLGFGYKNLSIIKPCIDIFDPKVIRASMGAIFNINIQLFDNFNDYEKINKNFKYPFMLQATNTLQSLEKKETPHTLIFGNEASGLDISYKNIGIPLLIKHTNQIDSLNLSMSVGIALYEFSK